MTKEELKLQCIQIVYHSTGDSSVGYSVEGVMNRPSIDEILAKAKLLYEWVSKDDA